MISSLKFHDSFQVNRGEPANLKPEDLHLFQHELERTFPEVYILKIEPCLVFHNHVFQGENFFEELTRNEQVGPETKDEIIRNLPKERKVLAKATWLTDDWSVDYFHWMIDCLGRLVVAREVVSNAPLILPATFKSIPFVVETLSLFNIQPIFLDENEYYEIKELWVPSYPAPTGNFHPKILPKIRKELLGSKKPCSNGKRIYISRAKAAKRKILNEEELIPVLKRFGFETWHLEEWSIMDQVRLLTETNIVLGLHGGGLTNIMFMPKGGKVIEIRNYNDTLRNCFFALASEMDLEYYYFLCKGSSENTHFADFNIDIPMFEGFLQTILR